MSAGTPQSSGSAQALVDRLWQRFHPLARERVEVLQRLCDAVASGVVPQDVRDDARAAAHKLAGALGTYGRPGSEQAHELEVLLRDGGDLAAAPALVAQLRQAVG